MDNNRQSNYFTSYEDLEIHKLMLEDAARINAYKHAILNNRAYFKDKIVLDVGCGTGILSVYCAQAGAKKVYAVEASNLAEIAVEIVKENNFEHIVEVIHSKVEDIILPEGIKVDAIVSEWMGFYLLHEGMLDSVLFARDKFLRDGGQMFPNSATIYAAPCSLPSLYDQWENVHGVKMSIFGRHLRQSKSDKPEILKVNPEDLIGAETALCWINLEEDKSSDLDLYTIQHVVGANRSGAYQGICVWFTCTFPCIGAGNTALVSLETGPNSMPTHWKQTVIVLPQEQTLEKDEPIAFQLDMKRDSSNMRRYTLQLTLLDPEEVEHPLPCSCHMTKCIVTKAFMLQHPAPAENGDMNGVLEQCDIDDY